MTYYPRHWMQLPVLLQAPTGCVGCVLNRWQGGHSRSARCRVENNLLPLPGIKPWTGHYYYNTARYQHQNEWWNAHEETLGRREQGWRSGYRKLKVPCDTSAAQPTEYRGSPLCAARQPEVAAAPARRMIVPTGSTVS
jgi:hypothetical protein